MIGLKLTVAHGAGFVPAHTSLPPYSEFEFLPVEQKRNERALAQLEFDVAEVSFSYYLLVREQGDSLIALPLFPYRTFWRRCLYCCDTAPLHTLDDLKGRRVALPRLSNTLAVWTLGDLQRHYTTRVRDIHWVTMEDEGLRLVCSRRLAGRARACWQRSG